MSVSAVVFRELPSQFSEGGITIERFGPSANAITIKSRPQNSCFLSQAGRALRTDQSFSLELATPFRAVIRPLATSTKEKYSG